MLCKTHLWTQGYLPSRLPRGRSAARQEAAPLGRENQLAWVFLSTSRCTCFLGFPSCTAGQALQQVGSLTALAIKVPPVGVPHTSAILIGLVQVGRPLEGQRMLGQLQKQLVSIHSLRPRSHHLVNQAMRF